MGLLTKLIILYTVMAICATLYAPDVIFGSNYNSTVFSLFNINSYNETTGEVNINQNVGWASDVNEQLSTSPDENAQSVFSKIINSIGAGINWVIDGLANVIDFIKILFRIIFSPLILLFDPMSQGMPKIIGLFIGIPMVLLLLFAIIAFIAGRVNP